MRPASSAPIRLCARGPSGTLTASTPACLSRRTCSNIGAGSTPFGGTISTVVTNRPSASLAPSRERSAKRDGLDLHGLRRCRRHDVNGAGRHAVHESHDGADVVRGRPAAAADEPGPGFDDSPGVARHVLWGGHVDLPVTHLAREAGVGLGRERDGDHPRQLLDRLQHAVGPDRAVDADHVGAHRLQRRTEHLGVGAVVRLPVGADRHLGDHREVAQLANGRQRRAQLVHVAEGLEDEAVHPAGQEPAHLPQVEMPGLVHRELAEGLDPDAQRPHGAGHGSTSAGGLARQPRGGRVDTLGVVGQPVAGQLQRVGAEGVGLQHLGARPEVFPVDFPNQLGLAQVELVVAHVEEHAAAVQHRAHGAVHHVDPAVGEEIAEVWHGLRDAGAQGRRGAGAQWRRGAGMRRHVGWQLS